MADSYKLTILKRLTTLLEGTTLTAYGTPNQMPATLSGLVHRGRNNFGAEADKTFVTILESPRQQTGRWTGEDQASLSDWPLLIQGFTPEDKLHPTDPAYGFLEDVEKRLERITLSTSGNRGGDYSDYLLGVGENSNGFLIKSFQPGPAVVRPATEGISASAFFWLPVSVGIYRIARR